MELSPFYQELLEAVNRGILMSIALIVPSALGGVVIGIVTGSLRAFGGRMIQRIFDGYAAL